MKAFQFRLDSVLTLRASKENEAKENYARALSAVARAERELADARAELVWSPTWCFREQGGARKSSICVSQHAGPLRAGGRVNVCGDVTGLPETPVLILLAWYLRVVEFEMLTHAIPVIG